MGNHRAERGSRRAASAGRAPRQPLITRNATGGARKAAAPASRVNDISRVDATPTTDANAIAESVAAETLPAPSTSYVGKRIARPAAPEPIDVPAPRADSEVVAATIAADADVVTATQGRVEAGRRRANRSAAPSAVAPRDTLRAPAALRHRPSVPVLAGVAALALAVGGAVLGPGLAERNTTALTTSSPASLAEPAAAALADRGDIVSRDSRREESAEADEARRLAEAEAVVQKRDAKLASINTKANKQAAKIEANLWHLPVAAGSYRLTATFGLSSRLWSTVHTGLDFAGATGTPLLAVANGTITETAQAGAYGLRTILTLEDGTEIWYCHQSAYGATVGQQVVGGETIGYLGRTGNSTGPHLHLEVRPAGGDAVDPHAALREHGVTP